MANRIKPAKKSVRHWVQLGFVAATNSYVPGFAAGTIYTGKLKSVCVPGLNCYSCPGAYGACPIGSLQAVLNSRDYSFSFYVAAFLIAFGALIGRVVCGWLCPFGFVQDLLYKIPFVKKMKTLPGDRVLRYLKYVILLVFVILLPMLAVDFIGQGLPWFCKYICPSGTLFAGIPLTSLNEGLRAAARGLFAWKLALLFILLALSIVAFRPFCRYLCPLGAIYGLFNPIALYRYRVDEQACTKCKKCERACPSGIPAYQTPNSPECIRCGACIRSCPTHAIQSTANSCGHSKEKNAACRTFR